MNWLDIPQPRQKSVFHVDPEQKKELEQLLDFVQTHQPEATLDYVVEEILTRYMRRKHQDFPVPADPEKMSCQLPEHLTQSMDEVLHERQKVDEQASLSHLVRHAIDSFFTSSSKLRNAYKKDLKKKSRASKSPVTTPVVRSDAERQETAPEEAERAPVTGDPSTSFRTQSVSSVHARPHQGIPSSQSPQNMGGKIDFQD